MSGSTRLKTNHRLQKKIRDVIFHHQRRKKNRVSLTVGRSGSQGGQTKCRKSPITSFRAKQRG